MSPTPAPPVKRYSVSHVDWPLPAAHGDWCLWSEVEVLLLQRAQEIAELERERDEERRTSLEDPAEQRAERYAREAASLTERLIAAEAILTARAQEIEQVKAAWQPGETAPKDGTAFRAYGPELVHADFNPWGSVEAVFDGERFIGAVWDGCHDVWHTAFIEFTHWQPLPDPPADAARVARAPQPEQTGVITTTAGGSRTMASGAMVGRPGNPFASFEEPTATPLPASADLLDLIAKWREQSRCASHFSEWNPRAQEDLKQMAEGQAYAFGECAEDLAAALARAEPED